MLKAKKALLVILTVVVLAAVASFGFSASAAECNHNIGEEFPDSTMEMFSEVPGTCVSEGFKSYVCLECSFITSVKTPVVPENHKMSEWETVKEATCKDEGDKIRYCEYCDLPESGKIPVSNVHVFLDETVLDFWWTADDKGVGAVYEGWTIEILPTCIKEGKARSLCTVCEKAETTAALHIHSNTFSEIEADRVAADCRNKGKCHVICEECNANYFLAIPVDPDNHIITYKTVKEATCTQEGEEQAYCFWHSLYFDEKRPIEKKPHTFNNYIYDNNSTCTKDGTKTSKCAHCDEEDTIIAEGTMRKCVTKWFFDDGASCANGGKVKLLCIYSDCEADHKEVKYITAGEHPNLRRYTVAPTCEEKGYTYDECPDCKFSAVVSGSEKPDTGHKYNWVTIKDGSCIADANGDPQLRIETGSCEYCGKVKTRETAVDHQYAVVAPAVEATCNADGATAHLRCIHCFDEKPSKVIPAFAHVDADGNGCCDVCYEWFVTGSDGKPTSCRCLCHNTDGLAGFFYKIYLFFIKLFGAAQECDCGIMHY